MRGRSLYLDKTKANEAAEPVQHLGLRNPEAVCNAPARSTDKSLCVYLVKEPQMEPQTAAEPVNDIGNAKRRMDESAGLFLKGH